MYSRKKLYKKIDELNSIMSKANLTELVYILGNRKEIIIRNILAGISRGVGIGIGVTIITAIIVWALQKIVKLNIPIIGEYIADIIDIVQKRRY